MSADFPVLTHATDVIRLHRNETRKKALYEVVDGLSDQYLNDLDSALDRVADNPATLPEAIQFVLRRVKCIEDADRVVASVCGKGRQDIYQMAA